jgi:hypothetical protein
MKVIGIDPGVRGLAWSMWEGNKLIDGGVTDLCAGSQDNYNTISDKDCLNRILKWFHMFGSKFMLFKPDVVVMEEQRVVQTDKRKGRMVGVLWALSILFGAICNDIRWVSPRMVKMRFGIAKKNYVANKKASVEMFKKLHPEVLEMECFKGLSPKHQGDLADACWMALFILINQPQ